MSAPLPLLLEPLPDETWHSYLTRRAAQHHCTVAELADSIGLRRDGRWPPYHGVALDPAIRDQVAPRLSLAPQVVDGLHLAAYDQLAFDLAGLLDAPGINTSRAVAARHWTWLAGSTYCPACLDDDSAWRLTWRIPWITSCTLHGITLVGRCPACGSVPGLGNALHASAPHRVGAAPDGRLCTRPAGQDTCQADLTAAARTPVTRDRLDRTSHMHQVLTSGRGVVLGQPRTALQTLTAWQSAIGLAIHLGVADSQGWGRRHRQLNPPRDPDLIDRLLATVEPLVTAPDAHAGAEVLQAWCAQAGIRVPHRDTFARATRPSAALQPAVDHLLRRQGRAHARLQRHLQSGEGTPLVDLGYTADGIPQLAWPCTLPAHLRDSTLPDQRILRAVVSMILVRAVDGGDWVSAGQALGLPADKARNWTRYAFSSRFGTLKDDLVQAALSCISALPSQPGPRAWRRRPAIDGYGVHALAHAQQPSCRLQGRSRWCPCTALAHDDRPDPRAPRRSR